MRAWRSAGRWAAPLGLVDGIRRWRGARRAGLAISLPHAVLGRRARWLERSGLWTLPPAALAVPGPIVDVGAHLGEWAIPVLQLVGDRPLIAVEPTPESAAEFRRRLSGDPRVTLHEVAAGSRVGRAELMLSNRPVFNSLLPLTAGIGQNYPSVAGIGTTEVACTTLDSLLADVPAIAILKIDVQGTEADVLAGAVQTLARTECVMIEMNFVSHYEGDSLAWDLHPLLLAAGFALHRYTHEYYDTAGRLLWADAVYSRG
jgi:FkbM family methyltransferase